MVTRLPNSPTAENFADSVLSLVEPIATAIAGRDQRLTESEIRDAVARKRITREESDLAAETILTGLRESGATRPSLRSTVAGIGRRALREGEQATGTDRRLSEDDALRALPSDLAKLFLHLRSRVPTSRPSEPITPPSEPATGAALPITSAAAPGSNLDLTVAGGDLTIRPRRGPSEATAINLDLAGRRIEVPIPASPSARTVVEAIRAAAPDLDLLVTGGTVREMTVRLYPQGEAPRPRSPVYAHFLSPQPNPGTTHNFVRRVHGLRSFELEPTYGNNWTPGTTVRLVVDDKIYEVPPSGGRDEGVDAVWTLKRMLEADGIRLDFVDWGGGSLFKFKLL